MIYEVFRQERKGQAFAHAGSVEAPDLAFADELQKNYHRVDGYPLKEKLGKARERAEAARAR